MDEVGDVENHVEASGLGILKIWMNKFRLRIRRSRKRFG